MSIRTKPRGAGNIGTVVIDGTTGEVVSGGNPGGQLAGGFADIEVVDGDGNVVFAIEDVFGSAGELPAGAHNSGPGDDLCDGVGVDDGFACS